MALAEIALDGWELDDAELIAQAYPATFCCPSAEDESLSLRVIWSS